MNDFAAALAPKSDQINAQDLIAGDMTITIEAVNVTPGTEQPVSIRFRGSAKVWRPCKTTGRILMAAWGPDTSQYPGRSVQLYLDPEVKWGGMKVGGIRIRAMSHINGELRLALAESKQNRKMVVVQPLSAPKADRQAPPANDGLTIASVAKQQAERGSDAFREWLKTDRAKAAYADGSLTAAILTDCRAIASGADAMRAMPDPLADMADPLPPTATATDDEIAAQIAREIADRALENG